MRDPRFIEASAQAQTDARNDAVRERLAATRNRTEIHCLLVRWWTEVLAKDSAEAEWEAAQIARLRETISSASADLHELALTAPDSLAPSASAEDRCVGAILLGESAAAVIRESKTAASLDRAVKFLADRCWEAIHVITCRFGDSPAWPATLEVLAPAPDISALLGRHYDPPPHDRLTAEEDAARKNGLSEYFWGQCSELYLNATTRVRLAIVATRDWGLLARLADALPLRGLRDDLWRRANLHEDRDAICALLRAAPPVFVDGEWTGSTSALAAIRAALEHGDRLHERLLQETRVFAPPPDVSMKLNALKDDELPRWLNQLALAASARPDGRDLLLLFAARLVGQVLTPPWNGQRVWSSADAALHAIYQSMATKPSVAEMRQIALRCGAPDHRTTIDDATILITAAGFDADAMEVWTSYRELLVKRDEGLCWQARNWRRALCYRAVAERLGQLTNPFAEWKAVWNALFVTDREHARFARFGNDALHPSLHLLRVGAELLRQSPTRTGAPSFFVELLTHARSLVANDARRMSPLKPEFVLFDAMDVAPLLGPDWQDTLKDHRSVFSSAKRRLFAAAGLIEAGASYADAEAAIEAPPYRLAESIAEARAFNKGKAHYERDNELAHVCEVVANAAASESERSR